MYDMWYDIGLCEKPQDTYADTKNNTFDCKECGLVFCTPSGLVKHMRVHTGEKLTLSHMCTLCNTWFSTKDSLGAHMRRHQKHEKNKTVGMLCASE